MTLRPVVKIMGGKKHLWKWIVQSFPPDYENMVYGELFIGGGSVFLNKKPSGLEYINDIDEGLISIWRTIFYPEFLQQLHSLSYSENTFKAALIYLLHKNKGLIEWAVAEYVKRRMSRGGLGKTFAWSDRLRGGEPGDVHGWNTALAQLSSIADRTQHAHISCKNALDLIHELDSPQTLLYLDPPYLKETRTAKNTYQYDFTNEDHIELLEIIIGFKGKVLISGYESSLYAKYLSGWRLEKKEMPNHSGQGKTKQRRVECLWCNF